MLGFTGPRAEAEQIKAKLATFLRSNLALELNAGKTLITHARTSAARFLGYEITVQHAASKLTNGQRTVNGVVALRVPRDVITAQCAPYLRRGKPACCPQLMNLSDPLIISTYGARYRGVVQYYLLAGDVGRLNRLRWVMETSMLRTLAAKHRSTARAMAARYKAVIDTPQGKRTCFQARVQRPGRKPLVTRFGGIPLTRQKKAVLDDRTPTPETSRRTGKELLTRLRGSRCEWCQQRGPVQVHHVRQLADLATPGQPQPEWATLMARMRRKTLVVCPPCHDKTHHRHPATTPTA